MSNSVQSLHNSDDTNELSKNKSKQKGHDDSSNNNSKNKSNLLVDNSSQMTEILLMDQVKNYF